MIVEKKVFELERFTTANGADLKSVRIGWESYGELNADASNAVLITHFFSATSHAAGRYSPADELPGYWDAIIGPGKAIDTDRYFVLSSDTLVNINVNDPKVTTTGPASLDPDTGKPYGMSFPVVSIRDFVNVQKALVESLGISKLKAVVGPSMGALQAYEWATAYPEMVERIVPVIGAAGGDPFLIAWLDIWAQPIRLDPNWRGGDYYGGEPPMEGVRLALKTIMLHANQAGWAAGFGKEPAEPGRDPADALANRFKIVEFIDQACALRAPVVDANTLLYMVRANQLAGADPARIKSADADRLLTDRPCFSAALDRAHGGGDRGERHAGRNGCDRRSQRAPERSFACSPGRASDRSFSGRMTFSQASPVKRL